MASDPRRTVPIVALLTVLVALAPGCTRTSGDDEAGGHGPWAAATADALDGAIRVDDGPVPRLELPVEADAPLFDQAGAALALDVLGRAPDLDPVRRELADARAGDGTIDDGISPTEVLTWYARRLDPDAVGTAGVTATATVALAEPTLDAYTALDWARLLPEPPAPPPPRCPAPPAATTDAVAEQLIGAAVVLELTARTASGCPLDLDGLAARADAWLTSLDPLEPVDAIAAGALVGAADLADARRLPPRMADEADATLLGALADGRIDHAPAVLLQVLDRLDRAGRIDQVVLGADLRTHLEGVAGGTGRIVLAPDALRLLVYADLLHLVGVEVGDAIEAATDWDDPDLAPRDRLALAVAAGAGDRVELDALDEADPGPLTATIALRAADLADHGRCPAPLRDLSRRTVDALRDGGAPTAANPFTASGYAALLAGAARCGVTDPALDDLRTQVVGQMDDLRQPDGTYGPGAGDVQLTATAVVAACRLDLDVEPPTKAVVDRLTAPARGADPAELEASLAVALLDAVAAEGCGALP